MVYVSIRHTNRSPNYALLTESSSVTNTNQATQTSNTQNSGANYYYNPTYGECVRVSYSNGEHSHHTDSIQNSHTGRDLPPLPINNAHKSRSLPQVPTNSSNIASSNSGSHCDSGGMKTQDQVTLCGWLHRLEGTAIRSWKRRWVVLNGSSGALQFYKHPNEDHLLLDHVAVSQFTITEDCRKFAFKLENSSMKTIYLATDSLEGRDKWVRELRLTASMGLLRQVGADGGVVDDESGFATYQSRRSLYSSSNGGTYAGAAGTGSTNTGAMGPATGYVNAPPKPKRTAYYPPDLIAHNSVIYAGQGPNANTAPAPSLTLGSGMGRSGAAIVFPPLPPRPSSVDYLEEHNANLHSTHSHHHSNTHATLESAYGGHYIANGVGSYPVVHSTSHHTHHSHSHPHSHIPEATYVSKSPRPKSSLAVQYTNANGNIVSASTNGTSQLQNGAAVVANITTSSASQSKGLTIKPWSEYLIGASQAAPVISSKNIANSHQTNGLTAAHSTYSQLRNFSSNGTVNQTQTQTANPASSQQQQPSQVHQREESLQRLLDWKEKMLSRTNNYGPPSRPPLPGSYYPHAEYNNNDLNGGGLYGSHSNGYTHSYRQYGHNNYSLGRNHSGLKSYGAINVTNGSSNLRERSKSIGDCIGADYKFINSYHNVNSANGAPSHHKHHGSHYNGGNGKMDCYSSDDEGMLTHLILFYPFLHSLPTLICLINVTCALHVAFLYMVVGLSGA